MSATKCLKCDEPVLIPSGASLKATVRCPLCHEQFELGEMLDEVPPPLEIVQDPEAVAASDVQPFNFDVGDKPDDKSADAGSFAGVGEQADGDEATTSGAPAFQFDGSSSEAVAEPGARPTRSTARPKRKPKNPVAEIAKVIGGGVLGIALAIVGIWWGPKVFGYDGKDPFKLGPKVSSVAPWLVPEEFHGKPKDKDEEEGKDKDSGKKKGKAPEGIDLHNPANDRTDNREFSESIFSDAGNKKDISDQPKNDNGPNNDHMPQTNGDPPATIAVDRSAAGFLGIRNAETMTPSELDKAITATEVALTIWNSELESEQYRTGAMKELARLGKCIACVNQTLDVNKVLLARTEDDLLKDLAQNEVKREAVNGWAAKQLQQGGPELRGVVLAAEIKSIELVDRLFENRLELLTEGKEQITMLTAHDISDVAPPGTKVIVVGAIVSDPSTNFGGYGGDDPQVVAAGTFTPLESLATGKSSD